MTGRGVSVTETVLLAVWIGAALLFALVVAPAAFAVLPTRTLAGALVGRVLPVIFYAGVVIGSLIVILDSSAAADRGDGPPRAQCPRWRVLLPSSWLGLGSTDCVRRL